MKHILFCLISIIGFVIAQLLMEVPSSNGNIGLFLQHTTGLFLAWFIGRIAAKVLK